VPGLAGIGRTPAPGLAGTGRPPARAGPVSRPR